MQFGLGHCAVPYLNEIRVPLRLGCAFSYNQHK